MRIFIFFFAAALSQVDASSKRAQKITWDPWTQWSACTTECSIGRRHRTRSCKIDLYGGSHGSLLQPFPWQSCPDGRYDDQECCVQGKGQVISSRTPSCVPLCASPTSGYEETADGVHDKENQGNQELPSTLAECHAELKACRLKTDQACSSARHASASGNTVMTSKLMLMCCLAILLTLA